jgi:hypothetical protein
MEDLSSKACELVYAAEKYGHSKLKKIYLKETFTSLIDTNVLKALITTNY